MRARLGRGSGGKRRVDGVPFTRPLNYSPVVHARGGVAQDGSWRFFRGGEGGAAGRVLPDRTVGDRGRDARQGFFSSRRAAQMNSRWRWRLSMRFARIRQESRSGLRRVLAGLLSSPIARSKTRDLDLSVFVL